MYISRIALNDARYETKKLLASPYQLHAAIEHSFPPSLERMNSEGRILWRVDVRNDESNSVSLFVVSPEKPDFTHIVEQAGWPLYQEWETKDYEQLLSRLAAGQVWQFRLRANPARKVLVDKGLIKQKESVVGKIQGHVTVAQQQDWLMNKADHNGFQVVMNDSGPMLVVSQRKKQQFKRGTNTVSLATVLFDGVLEVTDVKLFKQALCSGIGRAKGFGCGLLTIAPVNQHG